MVQDPSQGGGNGQDGSFGFQQDDNQPKDEKYNTRYLVMSMERSARPTKIIILGVLGLLLVAIIYYLATAEPPAPKPEGAMLAPPVTKLAPPAAKPALPAADKKAEPAAEKPATH
jgi:hypothetical protein